MKPKSLWLLVPLLLNSCAGRVAVEALSDVPSFESLYPLADAPAVPVSSSDQGLPVTIDAAGLPFPEFARYVADMSGVSLVWAPSLDSEVVTLSVDSVPVRVVLDSVARRLGVDVHEEDGVVFVGESRAEDRAVLVRRTGRLSREELAAAVGVLLTESGNVVAFDDGVVIVSDRVDVLTRVARMLSDVEGAQGAGWLLQLFFVEDILSSGSSFGVDVSQDISIGAILAGQSASIELGDLIRAALVAELTRQNVRVVQAPVLLLLDGKEASLNQTETFRIPLYTTLETGIVAQSGLEIVDVGLKVLVSVRESSFTSGTLQYSFELGQVTGESGGFPVIASQLITGEVLASSGGAYIPRFSLFGGDG